jgi:hypothetical protein
MLLSSREMGLDGVTLLIEAALVETCACCHRARIAAARSELTAASDEMLQLVRRSQIVNTLIEAEMRRRDVDLDSSSDSVATDDIEIDNEHVVSSSDDDIAMGEMLQTDSELNSSDATGSDAGSCSPIS